jgi:hypothetical protein
MDNWIKVEDRLPDQCKMVLVYAPEMNEPMATMYFHRDQGSSDGEWVSEPPGPDRTSWCAMASTDVTHWMPLPEAPSGN